MPMTDVLDLQAVTIRRGTTTILDEVSWTVRDGERWVVLGRNENRRPIYVNDVEFVWRWYIIDRK